MKKTVLVTQLFLLLFIPPILKADFNKDNKIFRKEMLQGNISFGKADYDKALIHFTKARRIRDANSLLKKQTAFSNAKDGWDFWLSLVKKRKRIGAINPVAVHKVLGIFIEHTNLKFTSKNGKVVHAESSIPQKQKKYILYEQAVVKKMIEAYSDGKWTMQFENISINAAVTDVTNDEYKGKEFKIMMRYPILEKIKPFTVFRNALLKHIGEYDTTVLYWSGKGVAVAAGGGPRFFPLVPYQLYAPLRGWIAIGIGSAHGHYPEHTWNYITLFHEFFHNIQSLSCLYSKNTCISIHEFTKTFRHKVPQWKGNGELDYYRYRFSKTLSQTGWKPLNFLTKYPMLISKRQIENNIHAVKGKSINQLKRSYELSEEASKEKNKKVKLALVNRSLKNNPVNPKALRLKVDLLDAGSDYNTMKKTYHTYLELMPHDDFMYYKFALLLAQKNQHDNAVKNYTRAIELASHKDYYFLHRGSSYRALKKYDKSINDFNIAISLNDKNAWHFYYRAITYQVKKDYRMAIKDHNTAIALDSKNEWFYYNRGNCYVSLKNYIKAVKDFHRALDINPENHWVIFSKGNINYYHLNKKDQGLKEMKRAARLGNPSAKEILKNIK